MEDPNIPIPLQEYKQFLNPILIFVFYMILQKGGGLTVPNKNKIDLATENARKPAEGALNSSGNTLEQHASNAVSEVQTALNQAISSLNESNATDSQALEKARQQLTRADEFLDQAQTSANALRLPDQQ